MQETVFNLVEGKWVKIERFWVSVKKWPYNPRPVVDVQGVYTKIYFLIAPLK